MRDNTEHLQTKVADHLRKDFAELQEGLTVQQALNTIREHGLGEQIVYFYVTDPAGRLTGVVPTRRLLTAPLDQRLSEIMGGKIVAIPENATLLEACEMFVLHKFLAFPVVDEGRRIKGIIDINLFTREIFELSDDEDETEVFETLGFHISQVRGASPAKSFRYRFPWVLTTISSGTVCALLAGAHEQTLAKSLVLAFFLTLVLGLGESVSVQSMSVTIQSLRARRPTRRWVLDSLSREARTAALLGGACGILVGLIVWIWRGTGIGAIVIGSSILGAIVVASLFGLGIPTVLHWLKLDPKIAAGPITLACADISTLLVYFNFAASAM